MNSGLDEDLRASSDQKPEASASTTSFVKRSKPRTSGIRRRESGIADSASTLHSERDGSSSVPNSSLDADTEDINVVFRPRAAGRRSAASSNAAVSTKGTPLKTRVLQIEDDALDGAEPAFEIRRSQLSTAARQARDQNSIASTPSSSRKGTPVRLSALKDVDPTDSGSLSMDEVIAPSYTSRHLAELRASTPTVKLRTGSPAPTLSGVSDPMDRLAQQVAGLDHEDEQSLARSKYVSDFAPDGIPSHEHVQAAKDKRAKLRADFLRKSRSSEADDYISLRPGPSISQSQQRASANLQKDDGPHPNSRLPREEDEYGDGEEEFAEFTGATERIPIGERAEKKYAEDQRREMEAALNGYADTMANGAGHSLPIDDMDLDEDEDEWERAQMKRNVVPSSLSEQKAAREALPYKVAAIPTSTPLPTATITSARLREALRMLQQSSSAHLDVVESTTKSLAEIDEAERLNKTDLIDVEAKESWFRELEDFVASLARFMDEKAPGLSKLEMEAVRLLAERNAVIAKARSQALEDDLALFLGIPSIPILPSQPREDDLHMAGDPRSDGPGHSVVRQARLKARQQAGGLSEQLSPSDEAAFQLAQADISTRLQNLFIDTNAPEYLDPMARASAVEGSVVHPRSVVSRFRQWRQKYAGEYAQVWGGLSVAQIWEFYARKEMVLWDAFSANSAIPMNGAWTSGASQLRQFQWLIGIQSYVETSKNEAQADVDNGDMDMMSTVMANVVVPRMTCLIENQAFDPWSIEQSREAIAIFQRIKTCLVDDSTQEHHLSRYRSMVMAFLDVFASHVARLRDVLHQFAAAEVVSPSEDSFFSFLSHVVNNLLANLLSTHACCSVLSQSSAAPVTQSPFLATLHSLISDVLIKTLDSSPGFGPPRSVDTHKGRDTIHSLIRERVLAHIPITLWLASPDLARDKVWLEKFVKA